MLSAIALDKTGTITRGKPEVADVFACEGFSQKDLLRLAASVEVRSSHPLAQAVVARARQDNLELAARSAAWKARSRKPHSHRQPQNV